MERESDSPCHSHTFPGWEHWSPGRGSGQELEFRDCGEIPECGLLLTGELDRGNVKEEIMVGNACGGKPGSHGSKAILLSHK